MRKNGRQRAKSIRRMAREGVVLCMQRVARRRGLYERAKGIPSFGQDVWAMLHDAEYALSIAQGYYDPAHVIHRKARMEMAEKGHEFTVEDLMALTRKAVERLRPICQAHGVVQEFGAIIRMARSN